MYSYIKSCTYLNAILEVFQGRPPSSSGNLYDFCDGELYKQHLLFSAVKDALQIVIYYDEVEVTNPLGSYRGIHKLGMLSSYQYHSTFDTHPILYICRDVLLLSWKSFS